MGKGMRGRGGGEEDEGDEGVTKLKTNVKLQLTCLACACGPPML